MKTRYRAYRTGSSQTGLHPVSAEDDLKRRGILPTDAVLLWEVEADTWEEAQAIHHLRMGFGPYVPMGDSKPCPKCGTPYYPEGSGECWRCGKVSE